MQAWHKDFCMILADVSEREETYHKHKPVWFILSCMLWGDRFILFFKISLCPASFIHTMTIFIEFFFFSFYICTNTHLFYLIGRLFPVLGGGFVETFGEPVVCVRECVCVFVHTFGQRRGPVMVHGVCSHVLCVTLSSLFPPGFFFFFFSSVHLIDASQVLPIAMSAFISLLTCQML